MLAKTVAKWPEEFWQTWTPRSENAHREIASRISPKMQDTFDTPTPNPLAKRAPLGSYDNPIRLDKPVAASVWPEEFKDSPYIWALPPSGEVTKWYRSYEDYCSD